MKIDISNIIELGDVAERAFFNFLLENKIPWKMPGANLDIIDIIRPGKEWTVKEAYPEIKFILPGGKVVSELPKELRKASEYHTGTVVYQKSKSNCVCCEGDEHVFSRYVDFENEKKVSDLLHAFLSKNRDFAEGRKLRVTFEIK
jgi:hypothetical protein